MGRRKFIPAVIALAMTVSGCNSLYLYNAEKDELGKSAKTSLDEAKLPEVIPGHSANMDALLQHELDMVARHVDWQARAEISYAIEAEDESAEAVWLDGMVRSRLKELGFGTDALEPVAFVAAYLGAKEKLRAFLPRLQDQAALFRAEMGHNPPKCDGNPIALDSDLYTKVQTYLKSKFPGATAEDREAAIDTNLGEYEDACNPVAALQVQITAFEKQIKSYGGIADEIALAKKEIEDAKKSAKKNGRELQALLCEIRTGSREMKAEEKPGDPKNPKKICAAEDKAPDGDKKPSEQFADVLKKIQDKLKVGKDVTGTFTELNFLEIQLNEVDRMLDAISQGDDNSLDADSYVGKGQKAGAFIAATLAFADKAQEIAKQNDVAPVTPLVIRKRGLEADIAAASRRVARAEKRVALLEQKLVAIEAEADLLVEAVKFWNWGTRAIKDPKVKAGDPKPVKSAAALLSGTFGAETKERFQTALAIYAASVIRARGAQEGVEWRLIDLQFRTGVDASQGAIDQWNAMIAPSVDQISAFLASGWKPEEIAKILVDFTGLTAIAVGVN